MNCPELRNGYRKEQQALGREVMATVTEAITRPLDYTNVISISTPGSQNGTSLTVRVEQPRYPYNDLCQFDIESRSWWVTRSHANG